VAVPNPTLPVVSIAWLPKSGLILVPAMAAELEMSALTMVESVISADSMALHKGVLAAGITPAAEGTEAKLVKALPETFSAVVIWANLVSRIAAEAEISALTMVESVISSEAMLWPKSETLLERRASATVPEAILVAFKLVKLEPSTAGSLVSLVICTNLLAVLKVLPWVVTLELKRASAKVPEAILVAFKLVRLVPAPAKDAAVTAPALSTLKVLVGPTAKRALGLVEPTPILPLAWVMMESVMVVEPEATGTLFWVSPLIAPAILVRPAPLPTKAEALTVPLSNIVIFSVPSAFWILKVRPVEVPEDLISNLAVGAVMPIPRLPVVIIT